MQDIARVVGEYANTQRELVATRRLFESLSAAELDGILDPREQKVLRLRSRFEDGAQPTFKEIGVELDISRERVRQIQSKALTKLRKLGLLRDA